MENGTPRRVEAARLYRQGMSERRVAEEMGVSKARVHQLLVEAKVRRRSQKRAAKLRPDRS